MSLPEGWEVVVGLEVHTELRTATKLFCGCANAFGAEPNTQTCPVCLGLPGSLPVLNRRAVELAMAIGLALHATVSSSTFHRKNYFYPQSRDGHPASPVELDPGVGLEGPLEGVTALRGGREHHRHVVGVDVDDRGVGRTDHVEQRGPVVDVGRDRGEQQLALDGVVGRDVADIDHVDELVELAEDLLERGRLGVDDDGYPAESLVRLGRGDRQGVDVEPPAGEEPGDAREHTGLVLDEHREDVVADRRVLDVTEERLGAHARPL